MRFRAKLVLLTSLLLTVVGLPAALAVDVRTVDVVSITWPFARPAAVSVSDIQNAIKNDVAPRWQSYTTFEGQAVDRSILFQNGSSLADSIPLTRAMSCDGSTATSFMNTVRTEAYKRLNISDSKDRYLVILSPNAGCIWEGRALMGDGKTKGGTLTMQNSASGFVMTHELGHALGLGHSNFMRCDSGANDGPWGSDCKAVEYGGTVDTMGNVEVDSPISAYAQWNMGLLDTSEIKQSWTNETIDLSAVDVAGGYRAIFMRDGKSAYWVEYRRASAGNSYKPGLVIYRGDPPPISSIVSPNPEDALKQAYDDSVTTDIWMLNWDDYKYVSSKATGSMTLPAGKTATLYSGNLSISALATESGKSVKVTITRKADTTPPPTPVLTDSTNWKYPGAEVIQAGYDDGESAIASFEAEINNVVTPLPSKPLDYFRSTFLNPISPTKMIHVSDLPEGDYTIAIRATDVWGNKSSWSKPVKVFIDRGNPVVTPDVKIAKADSSSIVMNWSGAKDSGSGLCLTSVSNNEGFVLAKSTSKSAPQLTFAAGRDVKAKAQVFDCLGNGVSGDFSLSSTFVSPSTSKRTGNWSPAAASYGPGALKCTGKCSASITTNGNIALLTAEGPSELYLTGKLTAKIASSDKSLRTSDTFALGTSYRVVRIQGSNFVFGGLARVDLKLGSLTAIPRTPTPTDPTLTDATQKVLAKYGFNQDDFTSDWTVLPMSRGDTLLDATLDLCGNTYKSESGREARRQIQVYKTGTPYAFLSSEVVKYKSVDAASAALAELKATYADCVKNKGGIENGIFADYVFQDLPVTNAKLVDEKNRVVVRATIGKGDAARQLLAFYQFNGAYFTGLYIVAPVSKPLENPEVLRWFDVASVMAARLNGNGSNA